MSKPRDLFVRTALSTLALGGFLALLSAAPSVQGHRSRGPVPAAPPSPGAGGPAPDPGAFTFNGIPMHNEEVVVPACDARTWNPFTAGFCTGRCTPLSEQRTAQGATFAWREEATGGIHALTLSCGTPGADGQATHFSFAAPTLASSAVGPGTPSAGPLRPRTDPVPGLPGSTEVTHLDSGGLSIFVDRPFSAGTALEEMQLALLAKGWRVAGGPDLRLPADAPPTRVFVRGSEVYVATLEIPEDDSQPLLVSAYSRHGSAPEPSR
jgi:hypothetical protein